MQAAADMGAEVISWRCDKLRSVYRWCGLGYAEVTWMSAEDLAQDQVLHFCLAQLLGADSSREHHTCSRTSACTCHAR